MATVKGHSRKHPIHLLGGDLRRHSRQGGRGRTYGAEVDDVLQVIHEAFDYICAERLTPNLVWMAKLLGRHMELATGEALLAQLGKISLSTVDRRLRQLRQDERRLPRRPPWREKAMVRDIPMVPLG